jgi:hypothetical protein
LPRLLKIIRIQSALLLEEDAVLDTSQQASIKSDDMSRVLAHPVVTKVRASDIQIGNRIIAYCNNKKQTCTVRQIIDPGESNVTLLVFRSEHYRISASWVVRFHKDAFVDLVG